MGSSSEEKKKITCLYVYFFRCVNNFWEREWFFALTTPVIYFKTSNLSALHNMTGKLKVFQKIKF